MPQGWNQDQTSYALRYTLNKQIYILHGIVSGDTLITTVLDAKTLKTASVVLKTNEIVKAKTGITISDYMDDSQKLIEQISKEIIKPLVNEESSSTSSNKETKKAPLTLSLRHSLGREDEEFRNRFRDPLRDIGRGDLDPFGRGGGMLFRPDLRDPFNPLNPR